jgi:quinoprotein relay system zinc metallohydrolase 2
MRPLGRLLCCAGIAASLLWAGVGLAEPLGMTEVAPGIYVHHGVTEEASPENADAIANIGFIVGDAAVLVIDPGGSRIEGEQLRAAVRAATDRPIRYVLMTHVHPDHIFGAAAFRDDDPEFIGHAKLPGAMAQRGNYYVKALHRDIGAAADGSEIIAPTRLVADRDEIDLGNRRIALRAHGPAHTDNDVTVFDATTGTLWLADLLFVERTPSIDGSVIGWIKELDELMAIPAQRAVPGHGPISVAWPDAAKDEYRYLTAVRDGVRAAIKGDVDIAEAPGQVATEERQRWQLFDQYHARNVTAAYKELEWE